VQNMGKNIFLRIIYILVIPFVLLTIFTIASKGFSYASSGLILSQSMIPMLMALGISFTFIVGIFELSIGSQVILSAVVGGILYQQIGVAGLFIGAIGTGLICGVIMGCLYRFLRIPTMVISLGMLMVFEVIAKLLTSGVGFITVESDVKQLGAPPVNFIIVGAACVLFYFIYYKTKFGHGIRALGCNDYVAVNLGINNNRLKFQTYVFSGLFYGLAGALNLCYAGTVSAKVEMGSLSMMFTPIVAVLIGLELMNFINVFPLTILIGAFSVTVLSTGMIAVGLPSQMQDFVTGVFMLSVMIFSTNSAKIAKAFENRKLRKQLNSSTN